MKKFFLLFLFLVLTVAPVLAKSVEFAVVSDSHLIPSEHPTLFTDSEKKLIFTVESINKNNDIEFVVFLGDCIDKSNMESLQSFMNIVQNLNKPYYIVFGNHDSYSMSGVPKEDFSAFIHEYNKRQPKEDTSFYFKASKDAYGLVVDGSSYVMPGKHGRYLPDVLQEMEKLFKYKKRSMIFIFQHFPIIPPNDNESHYTLDTEPYLALIKKYKNIVLIASGHFHYKNLIIDENGIYHISAPALGSRASSNGSGCYEVIKVDYEKTFLSKPYDIKVTVTDVKG
ncbi:MAG: metallophosphoesterase [Candidatus Gastranaerophilales bacterium]|nr:metallophosphoesterase [Candidatus Gastranaerophilales bacterium]